MAQRLIALGFGKYVRADRIYAIQPLTGDERGNGRRTLVWVEGIPEPIVASRTEAAILDDMAVVAEPTPSRRGRAQATDQPRLFAGE